MDTQSVATSPADHGGTHDLWLRDAVLTVALDKNGKDFPPELDHVSSLNMTIQGLARALKAVIYHAENDSSVEASFAIQPIEDIADAIILLSQLAAAVQVEAGKS